MNAITQCLKILEKQINEKNRIKLYESYYKLSNEKNALYRTRIDFLGRKGVLTKGIGVWCKNIVDYVDFYRVNNTVSIPFKVCKKCKYHIQKDKYHYECGYNS